MTKYYIPENVNPHSYNSLYRRWEMAQILWLYDYREDRDIRAFLPQRSVFKRRVVHMVLYWTSL